MKRRLPIIVMFMLLISIACTATIPAGYYRTAEGKTKEELKTALHNICQRAEMVNYGTGSNSTWEAFFQLDQLTDGSVWDIYSNTQRYFDATQPMFNIAGMHIDQAFPKENWGSFQNSACNDLHNLYPADGETNVTKNYHPLGVVTTATFDNGVSKFGRNSIPNSSFYAFEPADEYKGDFARTYLYMSVMYENFETLWSSEMLDNNSYPTWKPWAINLLLQWHRQDPVSTKEIVRNDGIYAIQGNRNPFIDYPDLVEHIWGTDTTSAFPFPTETATFLNTPHPLDNIDFGGVNLNNTHLYTLNISGSNFTDSLYMALSQGNQGFSLRSSAFSAQAVQADTLLTIELQTATTGTHQDTLVLFGGGLTSSLYLPITAIVSNEFISLGTKQCKSDQGILYWMEYPNASEYLVDVYQGDTLCGDLFIYYYTCQNNGDNKAIGVYNGTADTINLSNYTLMRQVDGSGSFVDPMTLSGLLAPRQCYIVANALAQSSALTTQADSLTNSTTNALLDINGNDAIALYRNGVLIDLVGVMGTSQNWGANITMIREEEITHPQATFRWSEWQVENTGNYANIAQHNTITHERYNMEQSKVSAGTNTWLLVGDLHPDEYYTCKVFAVVGNDTISANNSTQIKTENMAAPLAIDATHITASSFYANWETVPGALSYQLSVFTLTNGDLIEEREGFDDVLSTGRPLPEGWNSNCYGTFTEAENVGVDAPALRLSNTGNVIESKTYPGPIEELSFTYRFPNSAVESKLLLEGGFNNKFEPIDTIWYSNTNKNTQTYIFSPNKEYKTFRWTYMEKWGNSDIALDDVTVKYQEKDTTFLFKNRNTTVTNYNVLGATEGVTHYYHVRSYFCHVPSGYSNVIAVTPETPVGCKIIEQQLVEFYTTSEGIFLFNMEQESRIRVFNITGTCLWDSMNFYQEAILPFTERNIYIIQIMSNRGVEVIKVIK